MIDGLSELGLRLFSRFKLRTGSVVGGAFPTHWWKRKQARWSGGDGVACRVSPLAMQGV